MYKSSPAKAGYIWKISLHRPPFFPSTHSLGLIVLPQSAKEEPLGRKVSTAVMQSTWEGCLHFGSACSYYLLQSCYSTEVRYWNSVGFSVTGVRARDVGNWECTGQLCSVLVFLIPLWSEWINEVCIWGLTYFSWNSNGEEIEGQSPGILPGLCSQGR